MPMLGVELLQQGLQMKIFNVKHLNFVDIIQWQRNLKLILRRLDHGIDACDFELEFEFFFDSLLGLVAQGHNFVVVCDYSEVVLPRCFDEWTRDLLSDIEVEREGVDLLVCGEILLGLAQVVGFG